MKIRMLRTHRSYEGGKEYVLSDEEARLWIANGLASLVEEPATVTAETAAEYKTKKHGESGNRRDK